MYKEQMSGLGGFQNMEQGVACNATLSMCSSLQWVYAL